MTAAEHPRISVALATYNGERFIREQLSSIMAQEPPADEIVIADDGSGDATLRLIGEARVGADAATDFRVVGGDHVGLRLNVERALEACTGEVIVLADQDDVWMPGKLGAVREAFSDPGLALWFSDAELVDEDGQPLGHRLWDWVVLPPSERAKLNDGGGLRRLLHGQTVTGATMAFRASIRSVALPLPVELDGADHLYLHDGWIAVMSALLGGVACDEHPYTHYRRHEAQVTWRRDESDSRRRRGMVADGDALTDERDRVHLVWERLRQTGATDRCRPGDVVTLVELTELMDVRCLPRSVAKIAAVWRQLRTGRYSRYARGWRTALADVVMLRRASR